EEITLVSVQNVDEEMFDVNVLDGEEVFVAKQEVAVKDVNNKVNVVEVINSAKLITDAAQVSAAGSVISTTSDATTVSAATTTTVTITTVDDITLAQALMEIKSTKPKEKGVVIQEMGESTTTISSQLSSQQSHDKGKGILIEPVKPMKKKDLIRLDEEAALKLQAEFDEEERLAREKAKKEKEANIALIETWDDIQVNIDTDHQLAERLVGGRQRKESRNKADTRECKDAKDEEEVTIDAIPLAVKSPSIVGWKIYKEGRKSYYQIMRADGKSQTYMIFSQMLKSFNRQDLEDLYKLVKAKYKSTRPVEDLDLLLWGDLKTMFEPHVEDNVWRNQQEYKVLSWSVV
ncbi:hypothetical protein Tco_0472261, partial [Tanacetum coccineum]